jgi:hypothetical protein
MAAPRELLRPLCRAAREVGSIVNRPDDLQPVIRPGACLRGAPLQRLDRTTNYY